MKFTRLKLYLSILFLPLAISCQSGVSISVNIVGPSELSTSATAEFTAETNDERGVEWRTTGGIITGSGTTITYQAPAEPGQYTLTATSRTEPSQGDSLQISVTLLSEARIEITSDESFLLTSQGDTAQVSATVYNADGSVDQDATITWASEDPSQVSIAADGTITAETSTGYTYVRASANGLESERVSVAVAQLAPETRVIPGQLVQGADPNNSQVTLARTVETEALNTGDIIVSDAGIMARITNLEQRQNEIVVTLEDVDFEEAFDRVVINGRSEPIEYTMNISPQGLMVTSDDERIGTQRLDFDALECTGDFTLGRDVTITEGDVDIAFTPELVFNYDSSVPSDEQKLQIFADWQPGVVTHTPITLTVGNTVGGSVSCMLKDPIARIDNVLASFWGILSVKGSMDINAGVSLNLTTALASSITLPDFDLFLFDIEVGAGYSNNNGWGLINNFEPGDASLDFSPLKVDPRLEVAFGALGTFDLGLTLTLGNPALLGREASIEFLEPSLAIGPAFSITPPLDPADPDYTGLIFTIRAQPALDLKLELGRDAARIFERFSVDPSITLVSFKPESIDLFKPIFALGIEEGVAGAGTFGFDTSLGFERSFTLFGLPISLSVNVLSFFSDLFLESQIEYYGFKYENEAAANDGSAPTQVSILGTSRLNETFVFEPSPADNGFWRFRALILDSDPVGPLPAIPFVLAPPASGLSNPVEVNVTGEETGGSFPVQFGTSEIDWARSIAIDSDGNVYISGNTGGSLFGDSAGSADAFLVKYDSAGNRVWGRQFGTSEYDRATGLAIDSNGSVYVAGITGGVEFADSADAFLIKYDGAGNQVWERQFGTSDNDAAFRVTTDDNDNIYVTGRTEGSLFGSNAGSSDAFLVKYDSAGNRVWGQQFGTPSNEATYGVAIDSNSNVYIAGLTQGSPFGSNAGGNDVFLVKYDSAGNRVWGRQFGTPDTDIAFDVVTDSSNSIYIVGQTGGSLLGGDNAGSADAFLVKYDSAGSRVWERQFGTPEYGIALGAETDINNNVYVTGRTRGSLFGDNAGLDDVFLVRYDSEGNQQ